MLARPGGQKVWNGLPGTAGPARPDHRGGKLSTGKKHLMSPGQRCVAGGGARKAKAAGKEGRAGDPDGEVGGGQFQKIPGC